MMPDPREPHDIAQQIINDDSDAMEELLKDTEVEDEDSDEEDFGLGDPYQEQEYNNQDEDGYF